MKHHYSPIQDQAPRKLPAHTARPLRIVLLGLVSIFTFSNTHAESAYVAIDRFVPHSSTVQANAGQRVGIYLREKMSRVTADAIDAGQPPTEVVLFLHGGSVPSVPDFDLPYKDYSWMEHLADAGFDTFAMDNTGYGFSPRPMMDNPCNMDRENQVKVIPNLLSEHCEPSYQKTLTTLYSDWDEIDSVIDYIMELRGVQRVHLIGWSRGGRRAGGYAARYPDKLGKVVLFAPGYDPETPSEIQALYHSNGVPMALQTREALFQERWQSGISCENQIDPGIRDVVWQTIMSFDALGAVWGPTDGVMRVRTATGEGWNKESASKIVVPVLIMVGEQDGLLTDGRALYADLSGTSNKVLIEMACSTHFALWESTQYKFMHEASEEWLTTGEFQGRVEGVVTVGVSSQK